MRALDIFVFHPSGLKADPAEDPLGEAVVLRHAQDRVHHLSGHKPVVPCPVHDLRFGDMIHQPVKHAGKKRTDGRLSLSGHPSCGDGIIPFLDMGKHFRKQGRRILQVRVHHHHVIPLRFFQSGVNGRFLPEIPGKGNQAHPSIPFAQLLHLAYSPVPGTVVDIQNLHLQPFLFKKRPVLHQLLIKAGDIFLLIVAGDNDTQQTHLFLFPAAFGRIFIEIGKADFRSSFPRPLAAFSFL